MVGSVVGGVVGNGVGCRGCLKQTMEFGRLLSKQQPKKEKTKHSHSLRSKEDIALKILKY